MNDPDGDASLERGTASVREVRCENLETVYIHPDDGNGIRIDDGGQTFAYLYREENATYVPVAMLDLAAIRKLLDELAVELVDAPPGGYPGIACRVRPGQPVADAVDRVARAIDGVFYIALRPDLK